MIFLSSPCLWVISESSSPSPECVSECASAALCGEKVSHKTTLRSLSPHITHVPLFCPFASWHMLVTVCIQLKTQSSPLLSEGSGISQSFRRRLWKWTELFPSPSEVIVLKISPGSLLKETTGWGQRQSLLSAVSCLASSF